MVRLRILHFNDVHSRFEELAKIASIIEEIRDEDALVLDAGDNADFSRMETEGTHGVISSAILNWIGVDTKVFGNNEGFSGDDNGKILSEHSDCPVVTCNMYDLKGKKLGFLADAVIMERSGVKVLIIGVTAGGWLNAFYELFGFRVTDAETEIQTVVADYEGLEYDLLIVLSHLGLEEDRKIASRVPGIDVIVGGHTHTVLNEPVVIGKTLICQAGGLGQYLGELVLDFNVESKKIEHFKGRLIPSNGYTPMREIMELIRHYSKVTERNLSKELFSISVDLDHSLRSENSLGNLLADALRETVKAEIGIINSGVLTGPIKKRSYNTEAAPLVVSLSTEPNVYGG